MSSTTSSRSNAAGSDENEDSTFSLATSLILTAHFTLMILKLVGVTGVSWWIIMIPELFVLLGITEIGAILAAVMFHNAVMRYVKKRKKAKPARSYLNDLE